MFKLQNPSHTWCLRYYPSKHARSDPETFWLQPVMAITASMQLASGQIVYIGSHFLHPFQLHFSKEGLDHIVQKWPGFDLDGVVRVWPNASGLEASWCAGIIWPGFWQCTTGLLPVSHFQTWFHCSTDVPDKTVQNQPWSNLVLADCVMFWPNRSGPEQSRCARIQTGCEPDPACLLGYAVIFCFSPFIQFSYHWGNGVKQKWRIQNINVLCSLKSLP